MRIKKTLLTLSALLSMGTAAQAASLSTPAMLVRATDTVSCVVVNSSTSSIDIQWESHWPMDYDPCAGLPVCFGSAIALTTVDARTALMTNDSGVPGAGVYRCEINGRFSKKKTQVTMQVWSGSVMTGSVTSD